MGADEAAPAFCRMTSGKRLKPAKAWDEYLHRWDNVGMETEKLYYDLPPELVAEAKRQGAKED